MEQSFHKFCKLPAETLNWRNDYLGHWCLGVSGIQAGFGYYQLAQPVNASYPCIAWIDGAMFGKKKNQSVMNA